MSRLPKALSAVLGVGVEVVDGGPNCCKRRILSALAPSDAEGGRVSWEVRSGLRGAASGADI